MLRRFAPVVPLYHPYTYMLLSDRVGCYAADRMFDPDWGSACLR